MSSLLNQLDEAVSALVGQWNSYSTGIATALVLIVTYSIMTRVDPEIHPMLLARQAQGSPVRNESESPTYRGNSAPHGMPLNTGLNIKEPGANRWAPGRDGDLRDIWKRVVSGPTDGEHAGATGRILTVLGKQKIIEHKLADVTRAINLIGKHVASQGGSKVAIYLPNSVEFVAALFACSFYNLTAVLLPYNVKDDEIISMLQRSGADTVITAPGSFPFDSVVRSYPALRQLIWVVDEGSSHLDWNEVPEGIGSSVNVSTWQDILNDSPVTAGADLPSEGDSLPEVLIFSPSKPGQLEDLSTFSQANLVSAISAQLTSVPARQRFSPADLFLPAASLSNSYTLALTLGALYSNASVAFNSVSGPDADLTLATQGVAPTVVVATPETLLKAHQQAQGRITSALAQLSHYVQTRSLVQDGAMPVASFLASYNDNLRPEVGTTPGKLRIVYSASSAGTDSPKLSEQVLSDLRVFLGARVIYALTGPGVAGAIAQTQFHDYRMGGDGTGSHFGPPVSSTEVLLRDSGKYKITDTNYTGEVVVRGPAVSGGEAALGVVATMREDNCLACV